ncbi:MAG: hypothetical protein C4520_00445 [Candidatus Abyssobacteria bacterium SURF_5]|uniref:Uncharacterized protein n=1 Tax=Abyssobacteria bacterium (strain SURF_5) TaxID=2093360 RepID=A0A3A4PFF9_ABYX5|nr:MAG: hypothetical protein C4520_00445 [Candidatus Abyssubacteria bacterium SURF_5]
MGAILSKRTLIVALFLAFFLVPANEAVLALEWSENVTSGGPQIVPYIISFGWGQDPDQITVKDPCTGEILAESAAYARGSYVTVKVIFRLRWGTVSAAVVAAKGSLGGLGPELAFFYGGYSQVVTMKTLEPLANTIGVEDVLWTWGYKTYLNPWQKIGSSTHKIYRLNKPPVEPNLYFPLVVWTTDWCDALPEPINDKAIADAIFQGFVSTGVIKYCGDNPGYTTDDVLCYGEGMCGGMKEVFYDACATQGVYVERSCWELWPSDMFIEFKWYHTIFFDPGLGRDEPTGSYPTVSFLEMKEVDSAYPCPRWFGEGSGFDDVREETRKAYRFGLYDGHCVNFLDYEGTLYLYDLSFGIGPIPDTFSTLPMSYEDLSGLELYDFRERYYNDAVDYMEGLIYCYFVDQEECPGHWADILDISPHVIPYEDQELLLLWKNEIRITEENQQCLPN